MTSGPRDASDAAIEAARHLFAQDCTFVRGVASLDGLPDPSLPEVAFAGRSNVGKSSLLNAVTDTKSEAAAYEFTTLTCIPGNVVINDTKIQMLDLFL